MQIFNQFKAKMKKVLVITFALFISIAYGQKLKPSAVPAIVKDKFATLYPKVKKAKWEKEKGNYEASFEENGEETSVLIDEKGTLIETETEIKEADIPATAKAYITKNYPGAKIKEASKIVTAAGITKYEAEVKGKDLIFDASGNFIESVKP